MGSWFLERRVLITVGVVLSVSFVTGILIGYFSRKPGSGGLDADDSQSASHDSGKDLEKILDQAVKAVEADRIRSSLQHLTAVPHMAAQKQDEDLTEWIRKEWLKAGLDRVQVDKYDMYLSWPNQANPNKIYLLDSHSNIKFTSQHREAEVHKGDEHPDFVHAFLAYSPAAAVTGQLVYVNYGRVEDMTALSSMGVSVKGKICIARYGMVFRGNKLRNCQDQGGIGLIIYSDPAEVAPNGTDSQSVYPNTVFIPGTGIQRGSVVMSSGDLLSPTWPAVDHAYRLRPEDADLPKIPCQPIGYNDAKQLLDKLGGREAPADWKGKIAGVEYRLGGEMKPEFSGWRVRLTVNNQAGTKKNGNVIGFLTGSVEPDRYVLFSNHRDAWGFGAIDPSSGTAQLMEIARVIGRLHKNGWKPRRTIVLCNWAAEEYGLIGSYEWVQDKIAKIMARSVALINTDYCASGPVVNPGSSPLLKDVVIESLKQASDPGVLVNGKFSNYYDAWIQFRKEESGNQADATAEPEIGALGSGSDHAPFAFYAGVPSLNFRFHPDKRKVPIFPSYPAYHTGYDTFFLVDQLVDPGFKIHKTCTQATVWMLIKLADAPLLPYNVTNMVRVMQDKLSKVEASTARQLREAGVTLQFVHEAMRNLSAAASKLASRLQSSSSRLLSNPMRLRVANDQLMGLERAFLLPQGLPSRPSDRHAIFAPAKYSYYDASAFPGLVDLAYELDQLHGDERKKHIELIRRHVSDLMIVLRGAASFLLPVDEI